MHLFDVLFHLLNKFIDLSADLKSLVDEGVDTVRVPLKGYETGVKGVKHLLNAVSQKWLLNIEKSSQNFVEHVDGDLKITGLVAVMVNLCVKLGSTLRDFNVNELQVLDFTKESNESRVEVDTD